MTASFQTAVSEVEAGSVNIRGRSQEEIMRRLDYAEGTFLTLVGRLPNQAEARLVNAMLLSLLDHGFVAATITAARYIASGNPEFVPAVAGGLLAAGSNTLSPEHSCALIERGLELREREGLSEADAADLVVAELLEAGRRVPGLGHPVHREGDFRATVLFELADKLELTGAATRLYLAIHAAFVARTGKTTIPINIDGCLACLGMDLGLTPRQIVSIALLGVLPGLMAHVDEEIGQGVPLRYITDGEYVGAPVSPLAEPVHTPS